MSKNELTNTYYMPRSRRIVIRASGVIIFIIVAATAISIIQNDVLELADYIVSLVFFSLGSLFAVSWARTADRVFIAISPQGIEYKSIGFSIRTGWDNIESIGKVPGASIDPQGNGLVLRKPAMKVSTWMLWYKGQLEKQGFDRTIPLFVFVPNWRENEVWGAIKHYAPQICLNDVL